MLRLLNLFCAVLWLLFQSCELEPDLPNNIVEPQILNHYGFPANTQAINSSIGSYPVAIPDMNGYCRFENISFPYDLQVNGGGALHVFNKLSIKKPRIVLPNSEYYSLPNDCHLQVMFPPIPPGKAGLLQFISRNIFKQISGTYWLNSPWSSVLISLDIPKDKTSIEGKLVFIQGESSGTYLRTFDNFGFKDVTIRTDRTDTVMITQEEIQFNPPESYVRFFLGYPEQSVLTFLRISLHFPGYNPNSDLTLMKIRDPLPGEFLIDVPGQLSIPYNTRSRSTYRVDTSSNFHNLEAVEMRGQLPGTSTEIIHRKLELLGPQDLQHGITKDSILRVNDDNEAGVYLFAITELETGPTLAFLTQKNAVRCGELKYRYLEIRPGKSYRWIVYKFTTFNSINEFTGAPYIYQENFRSVRASDIRYFSTAP